MDGARRAIRRKDDRARRHPDQDRGDTRVRGREPERIRSAGQLPHRGDPGDTEPHPEVDPRWQLEPASPICEDRKAAIGAAVGGLGSAMRNRRAVRTPQEVMRVSEATQ